MDKNKILLAAGAILVLLALLIAVLSLDEKTKEKTSANIKKQAQETKNIAGMQFIRQASLKSVKISKETEKDEVKTDE